MGGTEPAGQPRLGCVGRARGGSQRFGGVRGVRGGGSGGAAVWWFCLKFARFAPFLGGGKAVRVSRDAQHPSKKACLLL